MKKTRYFLIGFLLLSVFAFAAMVKAADYEVGVAENDELTWTVKTLDGEAYKDLTGEEYDESEGDKSKIQITKVETKDDKATITYDSWDTTSESFSEEPDDKDQEMTLHLSKDDISNLTAYGFFYRQIIPTAPSDYIAAVVEEADNEDFSAEGSTLTITGDSIKLLLTNDKESSLKVTYNNKGVLSTWQLLDADNKVVAELGLAGGIPGYELPLLLGITGIFSIGLIYTIMKRK